MSEPVMTGTTASNPKKADRRGFLNSKKTLAGISDEDIEIIEALESLKTELEFAHNCLNNITDDTLIDSYIFEIYSLNKKYDYYLRLCKDKGIIAGVI